LYRRNFFKFIGTIALMQVPVALFSLVITAATTETVLEAIPDPSEIVPGQNPFAALGRDYYIGVAANGIVTIVELVLVSGVATAALARMVAGSYLGEELSVPDAYRAVGRRWGPLVRAILLFIGALILLIVWTIVPCVGWLTGPGMMMVLAGMVFPLVAPVVVLEDFGARKSIRRAWELVRSRFWWVFGFVLLLMVFAWVVVGGPSLLTGYLLNLLIPENLASNPATVENIRITAQSLVNIVFQLLYLPLQLTCLTLLYFDLRVRSEGLDLLLNTQGEEKAGMPLRDLIAGTSRLPSRAVVTGKELANFAVLTVVVLSVYLMIVVGIAGLLTLMIGGAAG
jgi:hypothetical protein